VETTNISTNASRKTKQKKTTLKKKGSAKENVEADEGGAEKEQMVRCMRPRCRSVSGRCRRMKDPRVNRYGCLINPCGKVLCRACPRPRCFAPPPRPGCRRVYNRKKRPDGCPVSPCGKMICMGPNRNYAEKKSKVGVTERNYRESKSKYAAISRARYEKSRKVSSQRRALSEKRAKMNWAKRRMTPLVPARQATRRVVRRPPIRMG